MRGLARHGARVQVLLTASIVLLLTSGCAGRGTDAGYTPVTSGSATVDRPASWTKLPKVTPPWTAGFQEKAGDDTSQQLQVSGNFGSYPSARLAVGTLTAKAQVALKDFVIRAQQDIKVDGANSAVRTDYTFTDAAGTHRTGSWFVAVRWPYPASVAVSLSGTQVNDDVKRKVEDSLTLSAKE